MQILALVPGGIGDQILFFPTLENLRQTYPQAKIDVAVEPRAIGAYRVCKFVNGLIQFDYLNLNSLADWSNFLGQIRDREYDVVLTLERSWAVGILLWLSGIPNRIGYANSGVSPFLTAKIPWNANQYIAHTDHDLLQGLQIQTPCPPLSINVPSRDLAWAESEQQRLGVQGSGYVLIQTGDYPTASWQVILQDLQQRQPALPIVLLQTAATDEGISTLTAASPGLKVSMPTDTGKLAALIAGASLMLCPEGAALQLAISVQTYTLALLGATYPALVLPTPSEKCIGIQSTTGQIADIPPQIILERVWAG
ncbi:glycosyltransferase [Neosynechococcus sphagnicola sy1]|uniref:Glycosyltransferase n=1 Tax=Neosynechococcus sphagnicola sy1 TaxID=1497020 RepID=A0A098TPT1_9CYAN|nr:glycosyltransferase family 9 protein [Neosynechococcus sphagnicola]KGF73887.1 glycosyltransferase [Neosynechococcus sphagnicola sy1]